MQHGGNVVFPTKLKPKAQSFATDITSGDGIHFKDEPSFVKVYESQGDVLQECLHSYSKSYEYSHKLNDEVQMARTCARIAESYLNFAFVPVAFSKQPFDMFSRMKRKPHLT